MPKVDIPKIVHRAWFGGPMPEELAAYGESWERLHPGWEMRLWTDETLNPKALANRTLFEAAERLAPNNIGQFKADIVRYELLWLQGGVWIDCDFEARRPIDDLVAGVDAFAAWEKQNVWINNAILGAVPEHPFMRTLIEGLQASAVRHRGARPNVISGPQYLTKLWRKDAMGLTVFPQRFFYPYGFDELERQNEEFPDAYAVHHWNRKRSERTRSATHANTYLGQSTELTPMILSDTRRQQLADLDGLISEAVGLRLAELAATVPTDQAIVEIGSYRGKSTCYLAEGARVGKGACVWAVDPWDLPGNIGGRFGFASDETRQAFDAQVASAGLTERIMPMTAFSTSAATMWKREKPRSPIGMIFIDGSHLYADVRADFEAWLPLVVPEGIVAFDDYGTAKNPGVTRLVDELQDGDTLTGWDLETPPLAIARRR